MRVAVIGSRDSQNFQAEDILRHLPEGCTAIISGGARGIDTLARHVARSCGVPCQEYLPNYRSYGSRAPLIRNEEIVRNSDFVLAFWDFRSHGTAHTITACIRQGVPVKIIGLDEKIMDSCSIAT